MKNIMLIILTLLIIFPLYAQGQCQQCQQCQAPIKKVAKEIKIHQTYRGMATFGYSKPGVWEIAARKPMVIKDKKTFEIFRSFIPKKVMTPRRPAPDSKDPLLKKKDFDFKKHMLLVVFSHSRNHFLDVKITSITMKNKTMVVKTFCAKPNPREIVQKIISYGRYYLAVVDRFDGKIEFK